MGKTIVMNLYKIPRDVDLIVGIPRSGLLAGNLIALSLNIPIIDLDGFIENRKPRHGFTRKTKANVSLPRKARHALIVDDTILSGNTLAHVKEIISKTFINQKVTYCAVYADPRSMELVDIYLEKLPSPRAFEWNIMHNSILEECCIDIDGILCKDPTKKQNDDGPAYLNFLKNAEPLSLPSHTAGYLVTSRLEKYRRETEAWLQKHNIRYKQLHMLDLPDAKTRGRLNAHASFKAQVYKSYREAPLFIESEPHQAMAIARLTGRPALCYSDQKIYTPALSVALLDQKIQTFHSRVINKAKKVAVRLFDSTGFIIKKPNSSQEAPILKKKATQNEAEVFRQD